MVLDLSSLDQLRGVFLRRVGNSRNPVGVELNVKRLLSVSQARQEPCRFVVDLVARGKCLRMTGS